MNRYSRHPTPVGVDRPPCGPLVDQRVQGGGGRRVGSCPVSGPPPGPGTPHPPRLAQPCRAAEVASGRRVGVRGVAQRAEVGAPETSRPRRGLKDHSGSPQGRDASGFGGVGAVSGPLTGRPPPPTPRQTLRGVVTGTLEDTDAKHHSPPPYAR